MEYNYCDDNIITGDGERRVGRDDIYFKETNENGTKKEKEKKTHDRAI